MELVQVGLMWRDENNLTMNGLTYLANSNGFYWEVSLVMRAIFQQEGPTQLEQVSKC